jgi:hypothetical protein
MKRFGWLIPALLLMMPLVSHADYTWTASGTVTGGAVADNTTATITLPPEVGAITYLKLPTIDSASVAISGGYEDNTSVFYTIASNYSATALIDFTYAATTGGKLLLMPDLRPFRRVKITLGAGQSADRALTLVGK